MWQQILKIFMITFKFVQLWAASHPGIFILKGKASPLLLFKFTQFFLYIKIWERASHKISTCFVPRCCCFENSCSIWGSWKAWRKCCDCYVRQGAIQQQVSQHGPLAAEVPHTREGCSQCMPAAGREEDAGESWERWGQTSVLVKVLLWCLAFHGCTQILTDWKLNMVFKNKNSTKAVSTE